MSHTEFQWLLKGRCYKLGHDVPHAGGVVPNRIIIGSNDRSLTLAGYPLLAADGASGVELFHRHREAIRVAFIEVMMPGMSGMEVLDHIRTSDPNLLVIVITGYATVESAVEAMKKGAYDFIPKPFTPDQIRAILARVEQVDAGVGGQAPVVVLAAAVDAAQRRGDDGRRAGVVHRGVARTRAGPVA